MGDAKQRERARAEMRAAVRYFEVGDDQQVPKTMPVRCDGVQLTEFGLRHAWYLFIQPFVPKRTSEDHRQYDVLEDKLGDVHPFARIEMPETAWSVLVDACDEAARAMFANGGHAQYRLFRPFHRTIVDADTSAPPEWRSEEDEQE